MQYDILKMQNSVLEFRYESKSVYPWPGDRFCVYFAVTETAEALDALLREEPSFKRNNVKDHGFFDELGDILFMIMSVRDLSFEDYPYNAPTTPSFYSHVMDAIAALGIWDALRSSETKNATLVLATALICSVPLFDPEKYLEKTLDKQRSKWVV